MSALKDLTGQKFGRLTVVHRGNSHRLPCGQVQTMWICMCDCGNLTTVNTGNLRTGKVVSCGCYNKEKSHISYPKHGKSRDRIYGIWAGIKKRCNLSSNPSYQYYGGRGITICDEWNSNFTLFYEWAIAHGYQDGLSIDRINQDGNYEPNNCRWVSMKKQENNRRNNILLTFEGETHTLSEWAEIKGIKYTTLNHRIKNGWTVERALTEKVGEKHRE